MKTLLAILLSVVCASSAEVRLAWDPIQESNLAFYRIHWGPSSRDYTNSVAITNATTAAITVAAGTTNYFAATAVYFVGPTGEESDFSSEVVYVAPKPAPGNFRVVTTLQAASSPSGPWSNLVAMDYPLPPQPTTGFYRARLDIYDR